jgi:hypothetical protein
MSAVCCFSMQNAALAQASQGTPEQQQACQPDVFRLCGNYIPDADRIVVCLKDNERLLSPPCHDVFFPVVEEKPKRKKSPSKRSSRQSVFERSGYRFA